MEYKAGLASCKGFKSIYKSKFPCQGASQSIFGSGYVQELIAVLKTFTRQTICGIYPASWITHRIGKIIIPYSKDFDQV
jgi:hypothetical protein